ncbi:YybH family protein [Inquilinus sp. OTU3971]|uniref:YybH family protein n=1 Tax=Inquilinus sp. OTU3971 TaxID=3043855 RepID=UPI00313C9FD0
MTEDERAIRDLVETWMAASKAGDTATVLSLMSDDVVFMVPGHEPFGKEAFAAASAGQSEFRIDGRGEIHELQVLGDWAWLRSHLDITMIPPVGQPVRRTGWTLTILHKQPDGRWLLTRDANLLTVQPAATGEAEPPLIPETYQSE